MTYYGVGKSGVLWTVTSWLQHSTSLLNLFNQPLGFFFFFFCYFVCFLFPLLPSIDKRCRRQQEEAVYFTHCFKYMLDLQEVSVSFSLGRGTTVDNILAAFLRSHVLMPFYLLSGQLPAVLPGENRENWVSRKQKYKAAWTSAILQRHIQNWS